MTVVLLVDDDTELRDILEMALTGIPGVEILSAASGESAVHLALEHKPDLILTDFRMDGMTGIDLLDSLRASGIWPSLGAVVMSGDDDDAGLERRALQSGALAFWRKPLQTAKLRQFVRDISATSARG